MGFFRWFDGAFGGLIWLWEAWMVPQEARMGVRRPRWVMEKQKWGLRRPEDGLARALET